MMRGFYTTVKRALTAGKDHPPSVSVRGSLITEPDENSLDTQNLDAIRVKLSALGPVTQTSDPGQTLAATTTPAAFGASRPAVRGVMVSSLLANTAAVYVGLGGAVSATTGIELQPGDREFFPVSNANQLTVVAASSTQNVHALAI